MALAVIEPLTAPLSLYVKEIPMVKYCQLFSALDEYLLGDANTNKIFRPGEAEFAQAVRCEVKAITAKENLPVIWIDYPSEQ